MRKIPRMTHIFYEMNYPSATQEGRMAKDKSIVESITDTVKEIVDGASAAAVKALKPEPDAIAGVPHEQVTPDAGAKTAPASTRKKRGSPAFRANKRAAKSILAARAPRETTAKRASKKAAAKKSTKSTVKPSTKAAKKAKGKKSAAKRPPKKMAKKTKKSKR